MCAIDYGILGTAKDTLLVQNKHFCISCLTLEEPLKWGKLSRSKPYDVIGLGMGTYEDPASELGHGRSTYGRGGKRPTLQFQSNMLVLT